MRNQAIPLVVIALLVALSNSLFAQPVQQPSANSSKLTAEQWRADLRFFAEELPRRHRNLFHSMTREQFDAAVKQLDDKIPSLADHEITVEFMRIAALIRDGHSGVIPLARFLAGAYPVRLYLYKDGLFVRRAAPELAELVGAKVIRIGNASAEEAYSKARDLVGRDNEMGARNTAPMLLSIPEVLHALRLTDDMQKVKIVFEAQGQQRSVELRPSASLVDIFRSPAIWADARARASAPTPLWLKDPRNDYWFEYLKDQKTVYVQFNAVQNKQDESVATFFNRVFAFVAANPVDRFVLDLRLNGGGNNGLNRPIIIGLIKSKMDERGKFFAIIGRETFSAAQNLVNQLERYTNAIFVGEPTGGRPNHYGDARPVTLPNSGLVVRASTIWWQDVDPRDNRQWTAPEIAAELTSEDYRTNSDPAMEAIAAFRGAKQTR